MTFYVSALILSWEEINNPIQRGSKYKRLESEMFMFLGSISQDNPCFPQLERRNFLYAAFPPRLYNFFGWGYTHDRRADKYPYPHDRRADKDSYPHDKNVWWSV